MYANTQQTTKKFGKKALTVNTNAAPFMINKIITDEGYKQQENMTENIASGIVDFDQTTKRLKTSEKTFTAKSSPSMSLEKSMDLGHDEDILFLISQTEGNNHNLVGLGYIKLCFVFPNGWKVERQNRCRMWLTENLGFTESLLGNSSIAYSNNRTKRTDLCKAGKKVMDERNTAQQVAADAAAAEAAQSALTLEVPDEPAARSRPTSLNMSRPTSLNMSAIQRVMSTDSVSGRNSGNKRSHRDSMSFRDTGGGDSDSDENGAYSPKSGSGRTSRSSQSPFFMSNRSPRGMTASPMDPGLTTGLTSMRLDTNSADPEPRVMTRSRGNSNSTMMAVLSRSRGNSDSTLGESVSTKSRNGSLDLGRCASRTGPAIKEESQEDLDEDLDKEVASFLPNSASAGSLLTMEQQAAAPIPNGIAAGTRFAGDFFTAPSFSRSPLPLAPKIVKRSPVLTTVEGDEAVDIPSDTSTMRDSDEENDQDDEDGNGMGDHSPMSPSTAGAGQHAHERSSTPPAAVFPPVYEDMAPSEMTCQVGMHYEIGLSGGGNSPPSAMAMRRPLPSGPFTRRIPSPQRPLRKFVRSQTAPLPSSQFENSPGATVPAAGLGLSAGPFFHTPQAVRPADTFYWENTQAAPEHQLLRMREAFRVARLEYDRVKKIPLIRSKSEGNHSPSDGTGLCASHWDSDFMPAHSSRVSSFGIPFGHLGGRDSIGSVGGGVSSCPFQALTNDRGSGAHLMVCEDEMGMLGCSPIQVGIQVAQQALRDRRPSRPSSSNSVLGMYPSPQAAFSTVSPKHSHQHVNNTLTHLNHSPGSMLIDAPTSIHGVALAAGFTPVFANARLSETWKIKKRQSSVAKSRRMSVCALPPAAPSTRLQAIAESSFAEDTSYLGSPGPKTKCLSASKARSAAHKTRHSSIFSGSAKNNLNYNNNYNNNTSDVLVESSFAHHSGCDSDLSFGHNTSNTSTGADSSLGGFASDSHFFHPSSRLNEHNFKGIVIGGVYQHCFDNASPLVAAPTGSDKRVVDVSILTDNSLVLSLYQPRSKSTKQIELGVYWQWMRCSPTGYLAFRSAIEPHHKTVCYFLPKHPDDWKDKSAAAPAAVVVKDGRMLRNRRVSIVPQHEFNPRASQSFSGRLHSEIEMDFQPMNAIAALPSIETDTDVDGDNEMQSDNENEELNLSGVHAMDNDLDLPNLNALDLDDAASAQSEHWSNPNILALIFDFLIDDAVLFGAGPTTPTTAAGTSSRPTSRRTRKPSASNMAEVAAMQLQTCQTVNKTFALATYMVIAQRKSSLSVGARLSFDYARFKKFATKFQEGRYLSEGVCKNVYCVLNPATANLEAVSVMDIDDLKSRAMDVAITQELKISLLCSALVNLKICPNLVQVYSLFQADCDAPAKLWGAKRSFEDMRNPLTRRSGAIDMKKGDVTLGSYQYIRMEFCSGGDVEDRVRAVGLPDLPTVQCMFFQMCFSLYACREKLCMRHFDIKLLNFFVTTPDILHYSPSAAKQAPAAAACAVNRGTTNLQIALGEHVYNLPLQANSLSLIKLADFGTSAVGTMGLGDCITMQQFTTLENTPPEFLLLGSFARQSYSADTFPLGLCFFHLLTGLAPYEELLKDVHCPAHLASRLRKLWLTEDTSSPFYLIHEVVMTLDTGCEEGEEDLEPEGVLLDTIYRYMVLFGLSEGFSAEAAASSVYADSPVWNVLFDALDLKRLHLRVAENDLHKPPSKFGAGGSKKYAAGGGGASSKGGAALSGKEECAMQFQRDVQLWSMHIGNHTTMISFRDRLAGLGAGAAELMESLVHFDPARRCTMYDALQHPMFASLRLDARQTAATLQAAAHPQLQHQQGHGHGQAFQHVQSLHSSYDSSSSAPNPHHPHHGAAAGTSTSTVRYLHYYRGAAQVCTPTSGRSHALSFNLAHAAHHFCDALPIL